MIGLAENGRDAVAKKNNKILLVDDNPENIRMLLALLGDEFAVVAARDGERALALARSEPRPDIILLDVMMPGMNGYEVCLKLKSDPATRDIPVLFVTALTNEEDERYGLSIGAVDYIVKPLRPELVRARVRNHLDLKQHRDHLERLVEKRTHELSQAQQQLHQSQKMDAIGRLTGGIVHDFNNLLGVLIGNLDLLHERLTDDAESMELVDAGLNAALRGAELNKRLLASARRLPLRPEPVNVGRALADIIKLVALSLGKQVVVTLAQDIGCWPIHVDPSQFQNAIINLVINARDAMNNNGEIRIDATDLPDHPGPPKGDYVRISVSDTGCGMTEEGLSHAFEPFYTTKDAETGTGLGLSMVYGFVTQSGGSIDLRSELGRGTTIEFYLPRCLAPIGAGEAPVVEALPRFPAEPGQLLVLAVDDNPDILKVTLRQLRDLGYQTRDAGTADEALALIEQGLVPDILFTDIVMPGGMDGAQLADHVRAVLPNTDILLCSGFNKWTSRGEHATEGIGIKDRLLAKPFRKDELARALAAIREAPRGHVAGS